MTSKNFQETLPVGKSFWDFKIFKQILLKSVPAILTSMLLAFLPLVDNIFAGILGDNAVAAISYVVSLQFLFLVINIGMQGATGVILAQYFGRKDYAGVRSAHKFKVLIGLGNGVLAFAIFYPLANELLQLYTKDFGIINMGTIYLRITLFSLFFYWVNDAWASSLSQVGQTRGALLVVVFSVAANAILDWTFVVPLKMGIGGLAWSTVLVNIMATITYFFYAWKTKSVVFFNLLTVFKINFTVIKKTLKRWHMVLIEVSFSFGILFVNVLIARSYDDYNGVTFGVINGMVGIFFRILFASIGGFYAAVALFCGRYLGANLFEEAYVNAKRIYFSSFVLGVLLSALIAGFATFYVNTFFPNVTEPNKVQAIMVLRLYPIMLPAFVVGVLSFRILESGGQSKAIMIFDFVHTWIVIVLGAYLFFVLWRPSNYWIAWMCAFILRYVRAVVSTILVYEKLWLVNLTEHEALEPHGFTYWLLTVATIGLYAAVTIILRRYYKTRRTLTVTN